LQATPAFDKADSKEKIMLIRLRNYFLMACVIGGFYFLLSHHIVFENWNTFDLLKKNEMTLKYTFFSLGQVNPEDVMRIDELRDAGIADLMLEKGMITEEGLQKVLHKIDFQQ
jgi:hypothetical protein